MYFSLLCVGLFARPASYSLEKRLLIDCSSVSHVFNYFDMMQHTRASENARSEIMMNTIKTFFETASFGNQSDNLRLRYPTRLATARSAAVSVAEISRLGHSELASRSS